MRTELKIYSSSVYFNVDLFDDEPLPLEKSIVDIQEPDQRTADFTKSIKIPGTQNNNKIFSNIFDINHSIVNTSSTNFNADFNPNLKADCILFKDGLPQIRGLVQLTNINVLDEHNVVYEIVIIGRNANLFQDLGDKMLSQLDLSEFNHYWNGTNIENSWTASVGRGYVYPLIDRGYSVNELFYYYKETFPAVYLKTLVDRIFSESGYRYASDFFDSTRFKSLIIPYTGEGFRMSKAEVDDRLFLLGFNSDSSYVAFSTSRTEINFPNINKDSSPAGVTTNKFRIPTNYLGSYTFRLELDLTFKWNGAYTLANDTIYFDCDIKLDRGGVISSLGWYRQLYSWSGPINTNDILNVKYNYQIPFTYLLDGDIIYADYRAYGLQPTAAYLIKFNTGSSFFNSSDGVYNLGSLIQLSNALPKDFKCADLLKTLIKMFNLYFEPDKIDEKKLIIEPRDDFYLNDVIDITDKLDVSQDILISPMGALNFKSLEFHYMKDNDEYNKKYNEQFENEYGFKRLTVDNDFLTEVRKIEIPIAPTPLADSSTNDRVISKIRFFNDAGQRQITASKPRILYYGGLVNTALGSYFLGDTLNPIARSSFAYAGHLDSVSNPTFDLSFSMPEMLYYGAGKQPTLTNGNLYNLYWAKTISEITDKDSKLMECYVHLNNVDLQNISFRSYYLIDRQYYRLYRVETDLNSDKPAKCTFLKLKVKSAPTITQTTTNGGIGTFGDGEVLPQLKYYNYGEFETRKEQLKAIVSDGTEIYLDNTSQFVAATSDVYLPSAASGYDFNSNKSIEITVYNADASPIDVINSEAGETFTLATNTGYKFMTNGVTWFKI